jgi:hypothetical protein
MQEIQLLTREDVVDIVERELREQFQLLRSELIESVKTGVIEALREELPTIVEAVVHVRLESLQRDILNALEDAVRQVTREGSPPAKADFGDDFQEE